MSASYYLILNTSGEPIGSGYTPDGTFPASAVPCSASNATSWYLCTVRGQTITQALPPAPTLAQQALAALTAGFTVHSTSTPSINGLYACDPTSTAEITSLVMYIGTHSAFPGSLSALPFALMSGSFVTFPTTALFVAFATAVADYVTVLNLITKGASGYTALPASTITIF